MMKFMKSWVDNAITVVLIKAKCFLSYVYIFLISISTSATFCNAELATLGATLSAITTDDHRELLSTGRYSLR